MIKGIFIGAVTVSFLAIASVMYSCSLIDFVTPYTQNAPTPIKRIISTKKVNCWGLSTFDIYNRDLATFQSFSTGGKYARPSAAKYGDHRIQRLRLTYFPSFDNYWLIDFFRFADEERDDTALIVKVYDPNSQKPVVIGNVEMNEITINRFVSRDVTPAHFDHLKEKMNSQGLFKKNTTGKKKTYPGTNEPVIGFDGDIYYIEAKTGGNWQLIKRTSSDADYAHDFEVARPLLELVGEKIPQLSEDVTKILQEFSSTEE